MQVNSQHTLVIEHKCLWANSQLVYGTLSLVRRLWDVKASVLFWTFLRESENINSEGVQNRPPHVLLLWHVN